MSTIARFVRLDLRTLRVHGKRMTLPVLIIVAAATLQSRSAYGVILAAAVIALLTIPNYLFGDDERGRLDTLYSVLGIDRHGVVQGRYASAALLVVLLACAGLVLAPVAAVAMRTPLNWPVALLVATAASAAAMIVLAIELPLYFALGATRARLAGIAMPAAALVGVFAVAHWMPADTVSRLVVQGRDAGSGWLAVLAVAAAVIVAVPSYAAAARLYARRDL